MGDASVRVVVEEEEAKRLAEDWEFDLEEDVFPEGKTLASCAGKLKLTLCGISEGKRVLDFESVGEMFGAFVKRFDVENLSIVSHLSASRGEAFAKELGNGVMEEDDGLYAFKSTGRLGSFYTCEATVIQHVIHSRPDNRLVFEWILSLSSESPQALSNAYSAILHDEVPIL